MSAKWCGDGTVCQWELTMERFMDPCRDLCGFLPSDFSKPPWWTEQVCKHPPLAAFLASVATAVDFLTKRFQQASWWKEQVWEHRPPAAFSTPVSTTVDFAKRFQQAAVVDGTGMRTPTFGRFLGLRRDHCGFLPSDFSKPSWWTEQVCEHPPLATFTASVATAVDFFPKRFQQAVVVEGTEHRPPAAFSTAVSTAVDFFQAISASR